MLDQNTFLKVVDSTPLVSIDLIIPNNQGQFLLGLRNNRPAQGFWFVPGGRILKGETKNAALKRIMQSELGITEFERPKLLGVYEHFYDDCFAGDIGISTHYVVLAHTIKLTNNLDHFVKDNQHSEFKWWQRDAILESDLVNKFTKDYFRT